MTDSITADVNRRHDFVLLFDVTDGNPNGDPDAGNLPRVDPETMHGLVTDVSLKRKVRDYVDAARGDEDRFKIYVQKDGEALNAKHERAYIAKGLKSTGTKQARKDINEARDWMCANFYDIRLFGAVMSTNPNCGQVRGPVQFTFARSLDPVVPLDLSITRVAVTRKEDAEIVASEDGSDAAASGKQTEMGRKALVPYGLYRAHGFFTAHFASQTGVDADDLGLLWQALQMMWDLDRSSSRGLMACRGLYVFSHASKLGDAPAHTLFERVGVERVSNGRAARGFGDYEVRVDDGELPAGVQLTRLVG